MNPKNPRKDKSVYAALIRFSPESQKMEDCHYFTAEGKYVSFDATRRWPRVRKTTPLFFIVDGHFYAWSLYNGGEQRVLNWLGAKQTDRSRLDLKHLQAYLWVKEPITLPDCKVYAVKGDQRIRFDWFDIYPEPFNYKPVDHVDIYTYRHHYRWSNKKLEEIYDYNSETK
jgi:hypothetical protein